MERRYLPTFSELIDRLSILQLKEVFITDLINLNDSGICIKSDTTMKNFYDPLKLAIGKFVKSIEES